MLIREIVQQALKTRYLTREAEDQLRQLLRSKYDSQDLQAFMNLQNAVMEGQVQQESRPFLDNLLILRDDKLSCI
ncbi:hypothetical protein MC7420_5977 [Coleofasciculus chthonoplastes PCC 7420]|uniref:Uncharacterized protein n=1 Tax=Coleofasciculus chthonoplastes PCC 7420 TaxID=118168 RepID=B4W4W3_9CYAN|nr:hypothetical protein [Coleofasciculus chthonoplastes]EDX70774.1 hypothetical protein MC7420_5977 [Coleofasciculus chthonoplastes PCC 7420]